MSFKNKNNSNVNIDNNEKNDKKHVYNDTDNDTEECDKLLEQLDKMKKNENSISISSKARNLIKEDKEAIRVMNEKLNKIDKDELDYLDDEKNESIGDIDEKIVSDDSQDNNSRTDRDEADIDFLANLNKDDENIKQSVKKQSKNGKIRKQQPQRLHNDDADSMGWLEKLKKFSQDNVKNFYIGTAIAFLFLALLIALIADSGNKNDSSKDKEKYVTEFLNIDTTPMITTINNYYAALVNGEKEVVKSLLVNGENIKDEDVEAKCAEAKAYSELVGSSFLVTDCYIQQGVKKNEYIAYMKFQLQIKSIETPSVGIFTCYFIDESDKGKISYKISTDVNDRSSEVYKYIIKMSSCQNVTELFAKVDKELEEACAKDPQLKAIVDALQNNDKSGDNNETGGSESNNPETTEPVETQKNE